MEESARDVRDRRAPVVISGCVGPSDDGYNPAELLSAEAAEAYHSTQIATFAGTAADMVTAITMTYAEEAIGVTRAAAALRPAGRRSPSRSRPTGGSRAGRRSATRSRRSTTATGAAPAYYMINCAHPTHFEDVLRRRAVARADPRPARQRVDAQPRGARRGDRARRGRSARPRRALRRARCAAAAAERARRLLRHGPPPRRRRSPAPGRARVAMEQEIRFCSVPGGRIAYATAGSGPPLVMPALWIAHLELEWGFPEFRRFIARARGDAHRHPLRPARNRPVRPRRGAATGRRPAASGAATAAAPLDDVVTLSALIDALGLERVDLLGISFGAPTAVAFAARHPERVRRSRSSAASRTAMRSLRAALREALAATVRAHWGAGSRVLSDVWLPGANARCATASRGCSARRRAPRSPRPRSRRSTRPTSATC